jgi:hypothetical protein
MKNSLKMRFPIVVVLACLLTGCANRVLFTTQTSLGLDVSGTTQIPNKVSFSYNRFEAALVPRKTNGQAHSVYGGLDADVSFFKGHTIKQTFATGKAAMIATGADTSELDHDRETVKSNAQLVFLTATTFGLHLAAGGKEMSPNLLVGFRRSEAALVPVPDPAHEVRSVYADILINTTTNGGASITTNFSTVGGVRIKQAFATGRAAEAVAATDAAQQKLHEASGIAGTAKSLRRLNAEAQDLVDKISSQLDRLNDNRLPQAVEAMRQANLFEAGDFANAMSIPPRDLCRQIKQALARKTSGAFSDPTTVQQLKDSLARLEQISN